MKLYRFSPIQSEEALFQAIRHIHIGCYELCKQSFGLYLPNAGNIGVFCHYPEEYAFLRNLRKELTEPSQNPDQKYFRLTTPFSVSKEQNSCDAIYTHLYIRKPDPYRHHVGDIDFCVENDAYIRMKKDLQEGGERSGVRIFPRQDLDMIELFDPDLDMLAYVSPRTMADKVRVKQSEETRL